MADFIVVKGAPAYPAYLAYRQAGRTGRRQAGVNIKKFSRIVL